MGKDENMVTAKKLDEESKSKMSKASNESRRSISRFGKVEPKITRRTRQNSVKEPNKTDTVEPSPTEVLSVQLTPTVVDVETKSSTKEQPPIEPVVEEMVEEAKIDTPKKIEELTSEEMHRRERELEEAKRRIELESEKIRNEREKRHEARQKGSCKIL